MRGVLSYGSAAAAATMLTACAALFSFDDYGAGQRHRIVGVAEGLGGEKVTLALRNERLTVSDGPFAFATSLDDGSSYEVVAVDMPPGLTCALENGRGTVAGSDVSMTLRCVSGDSSLTSLSLGGGTISPAFVATTTTYSAVVRGPSIVTNLGPSTTVTATTLQPDARIMINGTPASSGVTSAPIYLSPKDTTSIEVVVTAAGGAQTHYVVGVLTRPADYLKPSSLIGGAGFGSAVALSGETLVVGAPGAHVVQVFRRDAGVWSQEALLDSGEPNAVLFGSAVAISGDRLVVGAPHAGDGSGAAFFFGRKGTTWSPEDGLSKTTGATSNSYFGTAVAMDGDTIAIGAPEEPSVAGASDRIGKVVIFRYAAMVWAQEAELRPAAYEEGGWFGASLSLSGDSLAIGAPLNASSATGINGTGDGRDVTDSGAVVVYTRSDTTWTRQAILKSPTEAPQSRLGTSVAIANDLLVAGRVHPLFPTDQMALVYRRNGTTWSLEATLEAPNAESQTFPTQFGCSTAIVDDLIAVGANLDSSDSLGLDGAGTNTNRIRSGAVYLFRHEAGAWKASHYVKGLFPAAGELGTSVALTPDFLAVGAPFDDGNGTGVNPVRKEDASAPAAGAVYIY